MLRHAGSPALETPRLRLRPYRAGDGADVFRNWAGDPAVAAALGWGPHDAPEKSEALVCLWAEGYCSPTVYRWAIEKDGEVIGDIAVTRWNEAEERCELGYCLGRRFRNQGLMTEALARVLEYLLHEVGFHRVAARHDAENAASGRVMEKCGMRFEGVSRGEKKRPDGTWMDVRTCAVLSDDPLPR